MCCNKWAIQLNLKFSDKQIKILYRDVVRRRLQPFECYRERQIERCHRQRKCNSRRGRRAPQCPDKTLLAGCTSTAPIDYGRSFFGANIVAIALQSLAYQFFSIQSDRKCNHWLFRGQTLSWLCRQPRNECNICHHRCYCCRPPFGMAATAQSHSSFALSSHKIVARCQLKIKTNENHTKINTISIKIIMNFSPSGLNQRQNKQTNHLKITVSFVFFVQVDDDCRHFSWAVKKNESKKCCVRIGWVWLK